MIATDETPIKAGHAGPGRMKAVYFWPVGGTQDEICFLYYPSRAAKHVETALGLQRAHGAVLQSDGYSAYAHYANKTGITHAQCWAHARHKVFDDREIEKFDKQGFLPSSPFLRALAYIRERRVGLSVYLDDPAVSIDTNYLERALRVIPMGKKNWLFSWTELGAEHVGIVQSLLAICRLHDINPYDYFVDVLQRVGQHPASLVHQLTPRIYRGTPAPGTTTDRRSDLLRPSRAREIRAQNHAAKTAQIDDSQPC